MGVKYKWLCLLTFICLHLADEPAPRILIDQGLVEGIISSDGSVHEYLGIPYASTSQETRFQGPQPAPKWEGVFKAHRVGSSCPQSTFMGVIGEENCLTINVYVPVGTTKPLPVMVWIHGGAFILGSGGKLVYGPEFLVKHDVILVTFNYRLGALGFLCLGTKEAPGNAGLKDQIAALRWVKRNIKAFGGDDENITVFGESAGGTSVSFMIATNLTDGLFDRAIVQSGAATSSWGINNNPIWTASLLSEVLGHKTDDPKEIYEVLAKESLDKLIAAKTEKPWSAYYDTELIHLPCIEKEIPGVEAVVTELPYRMLQKTKKNITVMYGSTNREGLFLVAAETAENLKRRNEGYLFASDLEFPSENKAKEVADRIKKFYFGNNDIGMEHLMNISDVYTHLYFEIPTILESEALMENNLKLFNYQFKYAGYRNYVKYITGFRNATGACHGDELLYLFKPVFWPLRLKPEDKQVIDWMTAMWTNFAKYGDPTPGSHPGLPTKWAPSKKGELNFMYIDNELEMGSIPNPQAYNLWKDVYTKFRRMSYPYLLN